MLDSGGLLNVGQREQLASLAQRALAASTEAEAEDEEMGEDVPEEFSCAILSTIMKVRRRHVGGGGGGGWDRAVAVVGACNAWVSPRGVYEPGITHWVTLCGVVACVAAADSPCTRGRSFW